VLVERESRRGGGQMAGRAANNRTVNFDGDAALIGQFVEVRITDTGRNSLKAERV